MLTKPSEELRNAMPEETKPVEREGFEKWKSELKHCAETCDGDLEGEEHDADCPLFGIGFATHADAHKAGWDAALERAADEVDSKLDLILDVLLKDSANKAGIKKAVRDAIRALKGSR